MKISDLDISVVSPNDMIICYYDPNANIMYDELHALLQEVKDAMPDYLSSRILMVPKDLIQIEGCSVEQLREKARQIDEMLDLCELNY